MNNKTRGFTIVELLIVIVVIAILAAISIVAYNGIQNRVNDSVIQSDAANIAKKLEIYRLDNGTYPLTQYTFPSDIKVAKDSYSTAYHNVLYCLNKTTDRYALGLVSKSGKGFLLVSGSVQDAPAVNIHVTGCSAVGTAWANDSTTSVVHGYNVSTNQWNSSWNLTK